jgi:hypothetical protein
LLSIIYKHNVQFPHINIVEHANLQNLAFKFGYSNDRAHDIHSYPTNPAQSLHIGAFLGQTKPCSHSACKTCVSTSSSQRNIPLTCLHRSLCVAATARGTLVGSRCECRCCSCTIRPSTGAAVEREGLSTVRYRSGNLLRTFDNSLDQN